ncbi:MAG: dCTP deaminase [Anaerolineae bacterium]|nr:dCTP deaminase [Chloroflexota bacterium]MBP6297874.1 dCTP deaminase [Anaerolineae bacterium]
MIYSDRDIKRLLHEGRITVDPAPDLSTQLGSCSLDLRLSNEFSVFEYNKHPFIDVRDGKASRDIMKTLTVDEEQPFVLHPGSFVLAITLERVELPDDIVARLEGRSSLGRLGIIVHATASVIDPGWRGRIVLELANHGQMPVALYPGMRVCSVTFEPLSTPVDRPYWMKAEAKYKNQDSAQGSKISDDPDTK